MKQGRRQEVGSTTFKSWRALGQRVLPEGSFARWLRALRFGSPAEMYAFRGGKDPPNLAVGRPAISASTVIKSF